ncbi:hypothetical protein F4811DRAFT_572606 [Daldinia bambusicola]|nr:hypothetical protein F4811DRAFT_572606 [Daldinia bambusicola]
MAEFYYKDIDWSRLFCKTHGLLTCRACLHSVNIDENNRIPKNAADLPEPAGKPHAVEPRFERFEMAKRVKMMNRSGLHPTEQGNISEKYLLPKAVRRMEKHYECRRCKLMFLAAGGPGCYGAHPSHISPDGQRYILVTALSSSFARDSSTISWHGELFFGHQSPVNAVYKGMLPLDTEDPTWAIETAKVAALTVLLLHIRKFVFSYRSATVDRHIYTNSTYFGEEARLFQVIVQTNLNETFLEFLGKVQAMEFSDSEKAYYEVDNGGVRIKKYPTTHIRQIRISRFLDILKELAEMGIQVHWSTEGRDVDAKETSIKEVHVSPPPPDEPDDNAPVPEDVLSDNNAEVDELVENASMGGTADPDDYQIELTPNLEDHFDLQQASGNDLSTSVDQMNLADKESTTSP